MWHPACHIQQYDNYGNYINGTDVDLDRAMKPHYGQASDFRKPPFPERRIPAPDNMLAQGYPLTANDPKRFECVTEGNFKTAPNLSAPNATPTPYKVGKTFTFDFTATINGEGWLVSRAGSWAPAKNFRQ